MIDTGAPRGQILVIVAVALMTLLAIAALVIDVGFAWMERRAQQNAVDPAAVAAARHLQPFDGTSWPRAREAACFFVKQHGYFTSDDTTCSAARASGDLYVGAPTSGPYRGTPPYIEVRLRQAHQTFFGPVIGIPTVQIATGAVAANGGRTVNSNSLVALDPTTCGAGMLTGNGTINITDESGAAGGSVYVNSICGIDPPYGVDETQTEGGDSCQNQGGSQNNPQGAMHISGNQARLITPHLYVRGTCNKTSNPFPGNCTTPPCRTTEGAAEISDPFFGLLEPDPASFARWGVTSCPAPGNLLSPGPGCVFEGAHGYPTRLSPGIYYGGIVIRGQAKLKLNPGIYYIGGGGIQMSGNNTALEAVDTAGVINPILIFSTGDPSYGGSCAEDENWPPAPVVPVTQYSSPIADAAVNGSWTGTFMDIDEFTAVDTDYLESPLAPTATHHFDVEMGGVDTPASETGVVIEYRYQKSADAGQVIDLTLELREGTDVIASATHTNIPGGSAWQAGSIPLTNSEAAAISDWYNLEMRIKAVATGGSEDRAARVSWIRVTVPPGSTASPQRRCQGKIEIVGQGSFTGKATTIAPWSGMLLWQDGTLSGNGRATNPIAKIDIGGQGTLKISGTVYGPQAECYLRGNGASDPANKRAAVQMVCWRFTVVGNGGLNMPYDPSQLFGNNLKGLVR